MEQLNWIAIIVAGVSAFVTGGIWYSPGLFGNIWMKDNNLTADEVKQGPKTRIFGLSLLFSIAMAAGIAFVFSRSFSVGLPRPFNGMVLGAMSGVLTFSAIAIHSLFEKRSDRVIMINGFYSVVALVLMGAIIELWQ